MVLAFLHKLLIGPAAWCHKERFARVGIEKRQLLPVLFDFGPRVVQESRVALEGTRRFCVVTVKVTDTVRQTVVAVPTEVGLDGSLGSAMSLGFHDGLVTHNRVRWSRTGVVRGR